MLPLLHFKYIGEQYKSVKLYLKSLKRFDA